MKKNTFIRQIAQFYDEHIDQTIFFKRKNSYYHFLIHEFYKSHTMPNSSICELGCGTGELLSYLKPKKGVGIDISKKTCEIAKKKYPDFVFIHSDVHTLHLSQRYDYVIASDLIGNLTDIQTVLNRISKISHDKTRIIITQYNFLWEWVLKVAEKLHFKMPSPLQNWISAQDMHNFAALSNLEIIKEGTLILCPIYIPVISTLLNRFVARLPLIRHFCLIQFFILRKKPAVKKKYSVSIIVPVKNEAGTIEKIIRQIPRLHPHQEIIFVEGHSTDSTEKVIKQMITKYKNKHILMILQKGMGKGDAVRRGFAKAKNEILMILDGDLSVDPAELKKFYEAMIHGKGDLVIGSRLVYSMERQAMRFLNIIANKIFSLFFTFLLDQPIRDTLCGTKVLLKSDYLRIAKNRSYFGNFDPFGDFDLILGASLLDMKIIEIPIRYKARIYGVSNINRFKHGLLLAKMALFAMKKIKFI